MNEQIAHVALERAEDVFALRQSGRIAAAGIGCDEADQVRFATALSELGREALARGTVSSATFFLDEGPSLRVEIDRFPRVDGHVDKALIGIVAARKLVDDVGIADAATTSIVTVALRRHAPGVRTHVSATKLRTEMQRVAAPRPLDELRLENRDLIATLSELKAQQDQLVHLNAELEETNKGVMAMYGQLADELEETNRGVVALYAELDDKTIRLNEANDAKSRFLASVSHELRSPVNSILALVRMLSDSGSEGLGADERKQLSLVRSSGNELLDLVNQLLDLAKAESGRSDPDVAPVDLSAVLAELRGSLRPLARPGVKLEFDIPDLPSVETDATLLNQVLRNLLANALKFTPAGSVRLAASAPDSHEVVITVSDTGIGIPKEEQSRIFEEFYQVRNPLQADRKGTGLGLPYARRVTQTLGGSMTLVSEAGRGSSFTVRIPTRWQPLLRAAESPGSQPALSGGIGTVIVIDDDESFRTSLRGMLQGLASRVLEAGGGVEGLRVMRESPPDLAFVDLRMPDLDGAAVLEAMRADRRLREVPAIIVSSAQFSASLRTTLGTAAAILAKDQLSRRVVESAIADALHVATHS